MKICANPDCKCRFTPSKHNPNQIFCDRDECKRYRDTVRQRRYYAHHSQNPGWVVQQRERKRRERARRIEKQQRRRNIQERFCQQGASLNKTIVQLVAGLVSMVSGAGDYESVESILHRCLHKGGEIYPEGIAL